MKNFFIGLGIVISLSSLAKVGNTISIALGSLEANQLIQSIQEEMGRAVIDNEEIITLKQLKQGTGIPMTATCSGEQSLESIQKQIQDSQQVVTIVSKTEKKCKEGALVVMKKVEEVSSVYTLDLNNRILKKVETVTTEVSDGFIYNTKEVLSQVLDGGLFTPWGILTADNDGEGKVQTITIFK